MIKMPNPGWCIFQVRMIANAKMQGHMTEQHKPALMKAYVLTVPVKQSDKQRGGSKRSDRKSMRTGCSFA